MSTRPGFSFLICPDAELARLEAAALLEQARADGDWRRAVYWGDEELPPAFWQDLTVPSLMGG